jgi:hypothetical protein
LVISSCGIDRENPRKELNSWLQRTLHKLHERLLRTASIRHANGAAGTSKCTHNS